jgi:diguanylate cyclase (GGDEF)-like protein
MIPLPAALGAVGLAVVVLMLGLRRRSSNRRLAAELRDPVTNLPNRALFEDRLEKAVARARRNGFTLAALIVSLDRFQMVNDSLGHDQGDLLLEAVAQRLRRCLRDEDSLGKLGGDEFIVLLEQVADPTAPARVAERFLASLAEPFQLAGHQIVPSGSIGIAVDVRGSQSASDLIRDAEVAVRRAKDRGNGYEMFDASMRVAARKRLTLETELRLALERRELSVRYQPLIELGSGEVVGAEALIRWQHPDRGELLPVDFLALAEQTGLIEPIGNWVIEEACELGTQLLRANGGHPPIAMNVNLSDRQLRAGQGLVDQVSQTLARTGLPPELLVLEITETVLVREQDPAFATLAALRELGVGLAIDDFGTGYSSLAYLRYLPVTMLKIDKSFVADLADGVDEKIVQWMVSLGTGLGMSVCAEGVETRHQRDALRSLGCDTAQGYLYARPVPKAELPETIASLRKQRGGGFVRDERENRRQLAR